MSYFCGGNDQTKIVGGYDIQSDAWKVHIESKCLSVQSDVVGEILKSLCSDFLLRLDAELKDHKYTP